MSQEELSPRPKISIGKVALALVGAYVGYRFIEMLDPQAVTAVGQTIASHTGASAPLTCAEVDKQYPFVSPAQAGGYKFNGPQTASCAELQGALEYHHSPIAPFMPQIFKDNAEAGINNAAEMGVAWQEGNYGTATWTDKNGIKHLTIQGENENLGAIRWADPSKYPNPHYTNNNGWMDFHAADTNGEATGWIASAQDHAALVNSWIKFDGVWHGTYHHGGDGRVSSIIPILSPKSDGNNPPAYIASVDDSMNKYYSESLHYQQMHPQYPNESGDAATLATTPINERRG